MRGAGSGRAQPGRTAAHSRTLVLPFLLPAPLHMAAHASGTWDAVEASRGFSFEVDVAGACFDSSLWPRMPALHSQDIR